VIGRDRENGYRLIPIEHFLNDVTFIVTPNDTKKVVGSLAFKVEADGFEKPV